jgi:hypothetical protein
LSFLPAGRFSFFGLDVDHCLGSGICSLEIQLISSCLISFVWNTTTVLLCHNYTTSAEIPPLPYEINLANNELTDGTVKIKLMGDVNGDGTVNMAI